MVETNAHIYFGKVHFVNFIKRVNNNAVRIILKFRESIGRLYNVSLYRNAVYLLLSSGISSLLGFVFWIIVAHFYSTETVGLASAAISAASLMAIIANFGLGQGLIRFLSQAGDKANSLMNTCFTVAFIASAVTALIFLFGISVWSPALIILRKNPVFIAAFIVFTVAFNIINVGGDSFIAKRRSGLTLVNGLINGLLKMLLVIVFAILSYSLGIFVSCTISLIAAMMFGVFFLLPRAHSGYRPRLAINLSVLKGIARFSFANYITTIVLSAPGYILPIIVINKLGAKTNAFFYMAWLIGNILITVASATGLSLMAEGSHDETQLLIHLRQALKATFLILVPLVIIVLVFADRLLLVFGKDYSQTGVILLRLLTLSVLPTALNQIYINMKAVEKKLGVIIALACATAAGTIALSFILLPIMGVNGVGIATLGSQGMVALFIVSRWLINARKDKRRSDVHFPE